VFGRRREGHGAVRAGAASVSLRYLELIGHCSRGRGTLVRDFETYTLGCALRQTRQLGVLSSRPGGSRSPRWVSFGCSWVCNTADAIGLDARR
jgi:hypothetical protein